VHGLTQRFADEVARLVGSGPVLHDDFAVAVSGGPDSLAMLALAHAAFGSRTCVLTVDHALRPESAVAAAGVAALAVRLGLRHAVLRWVGAKPHANLQAAARAARYTLMAGWCADAGVRWLTTAHHADDQAETVLLRLAHGSGVAGVAGIRAVRALTPAVTVVRPLLGWRRADLVTVVAATGWHAVDDPANRATRFDRTRARALLAATPWLAPARLAASAAHCADAEAALEWTAALAFASRCDWASDRATMDATGLPRELQRRLLVHVLMRLVPTATPPGPAVERWRATLAAGGKATLAGVAGAGGVTWRFEMAAPRAKIGA